MKTIEEIRKSTYLEIGGFSNCAGFGWIVRGGKRWASVNWADDYGWEHVSIAPLNHKEVPVWKDMCKLKDIFFYPEECCVQFHPPQSEYVNNLDNCLHIWRKSDGTIKAPPSFLVGIKNSGEE